MTLNETRTAGQILIRLASAQLAELQAERDRLRAIPQSAATLRRRECDIDIAYGRAAIDAMRRSLGLVD